MKTPTTNSLRIILSSLALGALLSTTFAQDSKPTPTPKPKVAIPRMTDFGADKCVPCKAMAPILQELQKEYAGRIEVVFVDVWKDQKPGKAANIRLIPTQVFYDATGKELARHEGFMSKDDILAQWRKLGFLPTEKK